MDGNKGGAGKRAVCTVRNLSTIIMAERYETLNLIGTFRDRVVSYCLKLGGIIR